MFNIEKCRRCPIQGSCPKLQVLMVLGFLDMMAQAAQMEQELRNAKTAEELMVEEVIILKM